MSRKVRFHLNRAGVRELMQSQEMVDVLVSYADKVKQNAGDGYDTFIGKNRANVSVGTASQAAYQDNLDNNTLEKAVRS